MPVKLYYSNTIDELCAALAGHLARERENPLGADVVFIPNPHLREWVQMRLADVNGIAANIDFQFLDPGLWKLIRRIRERTGPCPGLLDATQLRLVLYYLLTEKSVAGKGPGHPGVLMPAGEHGPEHETRAWQLAGKLAVNFSAYEHRRPDMIEAWKSGRLVFDTGMERAQRSLYLKALGPKGLCAGAFNGAMSLPAHARETDFASAGPCLPVIHFFCESQLSPFHAGLVFGLGSAADVYVYHLNPCSEFWEDVETPVEERWRKIRSVRVGEDSQGEYLDYTPEENRLLQAWGRAGREDVKLMSMVEEACIGSVEFEASWVGQTASAQENTVLGQLQRRIMARSSGGELLAQDRSVQIARCQTVYREVESVYASILHSLERDPSLKMTDIAVYVPDMEMYGPVIKSVFSREQRISMGMIDFTAASESVVGEAVIALFELARGDFTRSEVFTLVMNPAFQKARGIDSRDAETWLKWADSLNIFRGFSSDGNTAGESCTWQQGLRRLRMGRVMEGPSDALQSYRGIVPFADMNSNDSEQVGAISLSLELLHSIIAPVRTGELSAQEWLGVIDELIARFIAVPDSIPGEETVLMGLRRGLDALAVFDQPVLRRGLSLDFIREYITENLRAIPGFHGRYLVSGVNISALVPRRQVPFRVCYVMGMSEGAFPGTADASALDLAAGRRRIGDVSSPDANRYLFLQILMSTAEKLCLSYVARDLQRDQDFIANSPVRQLRSFIEEHVTGSDFMIVDVPLRSYDLRSLAHDRGPAWQDYVSYRDNTGPVVVSPSLLDRVLFLKTMAPPENREGKARLEKTEASLSPDFSLPEGQGRGSPGAEIVHPVSLADLRYFLANPAESVLARFFQLGRNIVAEDLLARDDEPFYSGYPDDYALVENTLRRYVLSGDARASLDYLRRAHDFASMQGRSPSGALRTIDKDFLLERADARIRGAGNAGLGEFLREKRGHTLIRGVRFGPGREEAEVELPPPAFSVPAGDDTFRVNLSGSLPFLWKTGSAAETLVTSGANDLRPGHFLGAFLFYAVAASGLDRELYSLAGEGPFVLNVELRDKIEAVQWNLDRGQAQHYLFSLLAEFLRCPAVDHLPADIVFHKNMPAPHDLAAEPDGRIRSDYRASFERLLYEEREKSFGSYKESNIMVLVDPGVPEDAFDKVRNRFGLIVVKKKESNRKK